MEEEEGVYSEPTEDPSGYLEPVQLRGGGTDDLLDSGLYHEISLMEGSVVDTDYMFNTPPSAPALDIDKYKIKQREGEEPLLPVSDVERELLADLKCASKDSLHKSPLSSINDLDRTFTSNESLKLSAPNINLLSGHDPVKCRSKDLGLNHSPEGEEPEAGLDAAKRHSDDQAVEKLRRALHGNQEGLITLYQGRTAAQPRLSQATEDALDRHGYRLTSSDC